MVKETDFFLSQDGLRLYYHSFLPEKPEGILCIIHGLGEHGLRYHDLSEVLTDSNIGIFAIDLRGHGQSQGKRGHARSYELLISDIEELLKTARAEFTDLPLFLMGHSLGGNLVANYVITMNTNELSGYILSSPWLALAMQPPKWKLQAGKIMARIFPAFTQSNELNPQHLSRNKDVVKDYIDDPLVHDRISAGLFDNIQKASVSILDRANEVKLKGLVYHGGDDLIIDFKSSQFFAMEANAEWVLLNKRYHEPHNDLNNDEVYKLIIEWIKKELS